MAGRDADLALGRTLPRLLRERGLADVAADAYFPISSPACTALEIATVEQIRERLVDGGVATAAEVEEHLDNLAARPAPRPRHVTAGQRLGTTLVISQVE